MTALLFTRWLRFASWLTLSLITVSFTVSLERVAAQPQSPRRTEPTEAPIRRPGTMCPAQLGPAIESIIQRPTFARGRWGILVESLADGTILYSHDPDGYYIPASNVKLLTTAAALQRYAPNQRIQSTSLANWIHETNLYSDNDYADFLLDYLGGPDAARKMLTSLGVDQNRYRLVDGSGLSRYNMATPRIFVSILKAMSQSPNRDYFYRSLPVAGSSGTLRYRLSHQKVRGRVHAKTGTLYGVRALSGYLEHPEYGTLVFSILVNQADQDDDAMVETIDQIVTQLAVLNHCE